MSARSHSGPHAESQISPTSDNEQRGLARRHGLAHRGRALTRSAASFSRASVAPRREPSRHGQARGAEPGARSAAASANPRRAGQRGCRWSGVERPGAWARPPARTRLRTRCGGLRDLTCLDDRIVRAADLRRPDGYGVECAAVRADDRPDDADRRPPTADPDHRPDDGFGDRYADRGGSRRILEPAARRDVCRARATCCGAGDGDVAVHGRAGRGPHPRSDRVLSGAGRGIQLAVGMVARCAGAGGEAAPIAQSRRNRRRRRKRDPGPARCRSRPGRRRHDRTACTGRPDEYVERGHRDCWPGGLLAAGVSSAGSGRPGRLLVAPHPRPGARALRLRRPRLGRSPRCISRGHAGHRCAPPPLTGTRRRRHRSPTGAAPHAVDPPATVWRPRRPDRSPRRLSRDGE